MTIYIDSDYKCHTSNADGRRAVEVDAFNGKCQEFVEGMRFVPSGETWVRADGVEFVGEMISPWKDSRQLEMAQLRYELEDAVSALTVLGVTE